MSVCVCRSMYVCVFYFSSLSSSVEFWKRGPPKEGESGEMG